MNLLRQRRTLFSLLDDEQEALDRFVRSVQDIQLFLRTYSYSGN